jgi:hypothetical protein
MRWLLLSFLLLPRPEARAAASLRLLGVVPASLGARVAWAGSRLELANEGTEPALFQVEDGPGTVLAQGERVTLPGPARGGPIEIRVLAP